MKTPHQSVSTLATILAVSLAASRAIAAVEPDGTIQFEAAKFGAGEGIDWVEGKLTLRDGSSRSYSAERPHLVGLGYGKVSAHGAVSKLNDLQDSGSTDTTAGASGAAVSQRSYAITANEAGVEIKLKAEREGVWLSAGGGELIFKSR